MLLLPTPRWRLSLLLLLLIGAGCQSTRTAFQFRGPAARPAGPLAEVPAAPVLARSPAPNLPTAARPPAAAQRVARRLAARPGRTRQLALLAASLQAPTPSLTGNRPARLAQKLLRPYRRAAAPPAGTAESGLGTTFLGIVGIVALVVGLVGLIFAGWGFFGWLAVSGAVLLLISILAPYVGNGH